MRFPRITCMNPRITRALALVLVTVLFLLISYHIHKVNYFEMNPDEGLNAIKASLMLRGYSLYSEIWSDQPPVFTLMLAAVFRLFGEDITFARSMALSMSLMLIWGVWDILKRNGGPVHALIGVLIVIMLPFYINLSISAMVGLPSVAIAILSLWALLRWHESRDTGWLVLSGVLLGLSVMTKLFTGFLVPVFAGGVLLASWKTREGSGRLRPAALWILACVATITVMLFFFVGWDNLHMLLSDHIKARETMRSEGTSLAKVMRKSREFTVALMALGSIGLLFALRGRRFVMLYPFLWSAIALSLLWFHAPLWYHQTPLFTVPAAIIGGFACGESFGLVRNRFRDAAFWQKAMAVVVIALLVFMVSKQGPRSKASIRYWFFKSYDKYEKNHVNSRRIVSMMMQYKDRTRWMFTNRLTFSFRTGIPVPPELVLSTKRMDSLELEEKTALDLIRKYDPEQVVLVRMRWPHLDEYLNEHYVALYNEEGKSLYVSKKLVSADEPEK